MLLTDLPFLGMKNTCVKFWIMLFCTTQSRFFKECLEQRMKELLGRLYFTALDPNLSGLGI